MLKAVHTILFGGRQMRTKDGMGRLEEVRRQFEDWRRTRERRTRIPEPLWRVAAEAAALVGVYRTAKALGINVGSLKKRVETGAAGWGRPGSRRRGLPYDAATGASEARAPSGTAFLELPPPAWVASGECTLELEEVGGAKMRVHLKGSVVPDLVALSRSFWEGVS